MSGHIAIGQVMWAKLNGYPWWPCKVKSLPATRKVEVLFFGDESRATVDTTKVKEWEELDVSKIYTSKKLKESIKLAHKALRQIKKVELTSAEDYNDEYQPNNSIDHSVETEAPRPPPKRRGRKPGSKNRPPEERAQAISKKLKLVRKSGKQSPLDQHLKSFDNSEPSAPCETLFFESSTNSRKQQNLDLNFREKTVQPTTIPNYGGGNSDIGSVPTRLVTKTNTDADSFEPDSCVLAGDTPKVSDLDSFIPDQHLIQKDELKDQESSKLRMLEIRLESIILSIRQQSPSQEMLVDQLRLWMQEYTRSSISDSLLLNCSIGHDLAKICSLSNPELADLAREARLVANQFRARLAKNFFRMDVDELGLANFPLSVATIDKSCQTNERTSDMMILEQVPKIADISVSSSLNLSDSLSESISGMGPWEQSQGTHQTVRERLVAKIAKIIKQSARGRYMSQFACDELADAIESSIKAKSKNDRIYIKRMNILLARLSSDTEQTLKDLANEVKSLLNDQPLHHSL